MRFLFLLFVLWVSLILSSCSQHYAYTLYDHGMSGIGLKNSYLAKREASWVLARDANIAVVLHSRLNTDEFPRTNQLFRASASRIFTEQFPHASILSKGLNSGLSLPSSMALASTAYQNKCEILLIAELSTAENNLDSQFELSGGQFQNPGRNVERDHLVIQFLIYESLTGQLLDRIRLDTHAAYLKKESHAPMHLIEETLFRATSQLAAL